MLSLSRLHVVQLSRRVPEDLVYSGGLKLTDAVEGSPIDAGKLVLSPTRTYAPVVKKLLDALRPEIHGMVHCSGGVFNTILNRYMNLIIPIHFFDINEVCV